MDNLNTRSTWRTALLHSVKAWMDPAWSKTVVWILCPARPPPWACLQTLPAVLSCRWMASATPPHKRSCWSLTRHSTTTQWRCGNMFPPNGVIFFHHHPSGKEGRYWAACLKSFTNSLKENTLHPICCWTEVENVSRRNWTCSTPSAFLRLF